MTARTQPSGSIIPGQGMPANIATLNPASVPISSGTTWSALGGYSGACWAAGCGNTGWVLSDYTIETTGNYQLAFGVVNANDEIYDSGLAIAGATVGGTPINQAPEPATLALLGISLAGFGALRHRK